MKNQLEFFFEHEKIQMRRTEISDLDIYYKWVNDDKVRVNSINSEFIEYSSHVQWFNDKVCSDFSFMYIFYFESSNSLLGQVRIDKFEKENIIDISVDKNFRGRGYSVYMLNLSTIDFFQKFPKESVTAYVKKENFSSIKQFSRAIFRIEQESVYQGCECVKFVK